jgi:hypothetical protein
VPGETRRREGRISFTVKEAQQQRDRQHKDRESHQRKTLVRLYNIVSKQDKNPPPLPPEERKTNTIIKKGRTRNDCVSRFTPAFNIPLQLM